MASSSCFVICSIRRLALVLSTIGFKKPTAQATEINQFQDLSGINVGLHDEIFHANKPVLVGVDAASTYCYLLENVDHRDEDTWGCHLLDVMEQGFDSGLHNCRWRQWAQSRTESGDAREVPCHGDVSSISSSSLSKLPMDLIRQRSRWGNDGYCIKQAQQMANTSLN